MHTTVIDLSPMLSRKSHVKALARYHQPVGEKPVRSMQHCRQVLFAPVR